VGTITPAAVPSHWSQELENTCDVDGRAAAVALTVAGAIVVLGYGRNPDNTMR